ncbi:hypothetical protein ABIA35_005858 [Catenulispora sp. MAP12-49]|uniref:hypothetical protein n=1 Tax=unclassified Catenulispora TaxID=414885 RepID=UPI0035157883
MTAKMTEALAAENAKGRANALRKTRIPRIRDSMRSTSASAPSTPGTTVITVNKPVVPSTL